jgi:hypothetical protein
MQDFVSMPETFHADGWPLTDDPMTGKTSAVLGRFIFTVAAGSKAW